MYKQKLSSFKKQIRREYLNEYFSKKRKQLSNGSGQFQLNQFNDNNNLQKIEQLNRQLHKTLAESNVISDRNALNQQSLEMLSKMSQTLFGVQTILKTQFPIFVLPFLTPQYYNKVQQNLATTVFCNITYVTSQKTPNSQFLRNITNILENTDTDFRILKSNGLTTCDIGIDTIDNCLHIIYNLMVDFPETKKFYIEECDILSLIYRMLDSVAVGNIIQKLFKVLTVIGEYYRIEQFNQHRNNQTDKSLYAQKQMRKFLKFYISMIEQTNQEIIIWLALYNIKNLLFLHDSSNNLKEDECYHYHYEATQRQQRQQRQQIQQRYNYPRRNSPNSQSREQIHQIQQQIQRSRILKKIQTYFPHFQKKMLIVANMKVILRFAINEENKQSTREQIMNLLSFMYKQINYGMENENQGEGRNYEEKSFWNSHSSNSSQKQAKNRLANQNRLRLKIQIYQLVYRMLSVCNSENKILVKSQLFQRISDQFQQITQPDPDNLNPYQTDLLKSLIHIFGILSFSDSIDQYKKNRLGQIIHKINNQNLKLNQVTEIQYRNNLLFEDKLFMEFIKNLEECIQHLKDTIQDTI